MDYGYTSQMLSAISAKMDSLPAISAKLDILPTIKVLLAQNIQEVQYSNMLKEYELGLISKDELIYSNQYRERHVKTKKR